MSPRSTPRPRSIRESTSSPSRPQRGRECLALALALALARALRPLALAALVCATCGLTGCIRSKVTITSDPPQAEVIWRGQPRGVTPITIPFKWYWYYDFALEKEGYERIEVIERFRTPPWFLMPLDIVAEIIPIPIPDNRERHYTLQPKEEEKAI